MSDEQLKKSDSVSTEASDVAGNSRMCSFSIERLLAPSKKNDDHKQFPQQTDLSLLCQESE